MEDKRVHKEQSNKNGLLSTYFVSLFSMMLCFVMLLGTSFAWFYTNNASVGNEIHSGILTVDLLHNDVSLDEHPEHPVFSAKGLWTPDNSAQEETVEVRNTGNVVLDYELDFVPVPDNAAGSIAGLFAVYADGTEIGTLDQFLNDTGNALCLAKGEELEPGDTKKIKIKLQMNASHAQDFMGKSVPVYLKLEASQHIPADATE